MHIFFVIGHHFLFSQMNPSYCTWHFILKECILLLLSVSHNIFSIINKKHSRGSVFSWLWTNTTNRDEIRLYFSLFLYTSLQNMALKVQNSVKIGLALIYKIKFN